MEVDNKLSVLLGFATVTLFAVVLGSVIYTLSFPPVSDKQYLIVFHDPIPGLERNSKVTLQGIAVGRVSRIELQKATAEHSFQARVWITILPAWSDRVVLYRDAAPRIRDIGNAQAYQQGKLVMGDLVKKVTFGSQTVECRYVYEVEHALVRVQRALLDDPRQQYTLEVERLGQPKQVSFTGLTGPLELAFSNVGTRATLQTNFVTNIQHIELTGGSSRLKPLPSLADLAQAKGQSIETFVSSTEDPETLTAVIPTQATAFGKIFDQFARKVPALITRLDLFMLQANNAVGKINDVLVNMRNLTQEDGRIATLLDDTRSTVNKSGKLVDSINKDDRLPSILRRSDDLLSRLNTQLGQKGELKQALSSLNEVLDNTRHWTAKDGPLKDQLAQIQDQLKKVSAKLTGTLDNADQLITEAQRQALGQDRLKKLLVQLDYAIRRDVRIALAQVAESMRAFKQTMAQMQSNPDSFFLGKRSTKRR